VAVRLSAQLARQIAGRLVQIHRHALQAALIHTRRHAFAQAAEPFQQAGLKLKSQLHAHR
jgi:hypothetical protein